MCELSKNEVSKVSVGKPSLYLIAKAMNFILSFLSFTFWERGHLNFRYSGRYTTARENTRRITHVNQSCHIIVAVLIACARAMVGMTPAVVFTSSSFATPNKVIAMNQTVTQPVDQKVGALTTEQRRAYLEYYAPLILKRADESKSLTNQGEDWMSNFDFDKDQQFSNNKNNWENIHDFIEGHRNDWDVRPTVYTAIIEYMTSAGKEATLLYHPYQAKQKGSIHDWERIEIKIENITGSPGTGENVEYIVITEHAKHNVRPGRSDDVNFMKRSPNGFHPMIWRAPQTGIKFLTPNLPILGELHFVEDGWTRVDRAVQSNSKAKVNINNHDSKAFHYVYVPQSDPEAVAYWNAKKLTSGNANTLTANRNSSTKYANVERITYELQDLADILPTFWDGGFVTQHWDGDDIAVLLETPLAGGLDGGPDVPTGQQRFESRSIDIEDDDEDRNGYIRKHWFWGTYLMGCGRNSKVKDHGFGLIDPDSSSFTGLALRTGAPNGSRMIANGDPRSEGEYFNQHDYFRHSGDKKGSCKNGKTDTSGEKEQGFWLPKDWHLQENGGFDGRWVQLFSN